MKLLDIVKNVGATAINIALPGAGSAILGAVNSFLPDNAKLPDTATGHDVDNALHALPPTQRAEIMGREFDVEITQIKESNETVRTMLDADTKTPHTTRPRIALGSFQVVAFAVIVIVSVWAYGVLSDKEVVIKAVMDGWPFILAVLAPLVTLLHAYFGVLKQEHKNRLDAANGGSTKSGVAGILSTIFSKKG